MAGALGLDPFGLIKNVGLDRACLLDPDLMIPVDRVNRLLEKSAKAAGAEDFGLRMAETRRISNLGPVALAARDAPTLREAMLAASRFLSLQNQALVLTLEPEGEVVVVKFDLVADLGASDRQAMELLLGVAHGLMRELSGGAWRSCPVWFSHGPPADMSRHLRMFGPWVEFGRPYNAVLVEAHDLDAPLPARDPAMARHVKRYLEPLLAQGGLPIGEQVRQLVTEMLASQRASADQVASRLNTNRRTLHRQLARDGESFSSILNAVRADLARRYIDDRALSLGEVAHLLGFSELSGFSRWFRAEFGRSPMSFRKAEAAWPDPEAKAMLEAPLSLRSATPRHAAGA